MFFELPICKSRVSPGDRDLPACLAAPTACGMQSPSLIACRRAGDLPCQGQVQSRVRTDQLRACRRTALETPQSSQIPRGLDLVRCPVFPWQLSSTTSWGRPQGLRAHCDARLAAAVHVKAEFELSALSSPGCPPPLVNPTGTSISDRRIARSAETTIPRPFSYGFVTLASGALKTFCLPCRAKVSSPPMVILQPLIMR